MEPTNILEFIKKQNYPDPEVHCEGVVEKPVLTPELASFRLNFINQIIRQYDDLKVQSVRAVEDLVKIISVATDPIDINLVWNELTKNITSTIDMNELISQGNNIGLSIPECSAQGCVIKQTDPIHPDNIFNRE